MGVLHLSPVGTSPGAVTCGLSYLKNNTAQFNVLGSIVENIVLFVSEDVRDGTTRAPEIVQNSYMSRVGVPQKSANVLDVIRHFVESEFEELLQNKGKVYFVIVDPNDYQSCVEVLARTVLHFAPPGSSSTGKNMWANLTGGTNVLNAALLQIAYLSGLVSRAYYTFISRDEDRKYLHPVDNDDRRFRWNDIPLAKTTIDGVYFALLETLESLGDDWYLDQEVLSRMKNSSSKFLRLEDSETLNRMDLHGFRNQWLNKLDGRELERESRSSHALRLSSRGRAVIRTFTSSLFEALIERGKGDDSTDGSSYGRPNLEVLWP